MEGFPNLICAFAPVALRGACDLGVGPNTGQRCRAFSAIRSNQYGGVEAAMHRLREI